MRGVVVGSGRNRVAVQDDGGPEVFDPNPRFEDWSDAEVAAEHEELTQERRRRETMQGAAQTTERAMQTWAAAAGRKDGDPWVQPTGAHDAYPKDAVVTHDGKEWESLIPANVWEPGVSGWRERAPEGEVPAWVQPTGAHDAYSDGDRVSHSGQTWVSDLDGNVWEPGVYGWTVEQ